MKRTFKLHWKTEQVETVTAEDTGDTLQTLANAMNAVGIGGGALAALDYWKEVKETAVAAGGEK